jgi:hypothetical protein
MSFGFDCILAIHVIVGLENFGLGVMEGEDETSGTDSLLSVLCLGPLGRR